MTSETPGPTAVEVRDALLDHLVVIIVLGLLGLGAGLLLSKKLDTTSKATTSILLNPLDGNPFYPSTRGEDLLNLGTEAQALRSDQVAAIAAKSLGIDSDGADLLSKLSVDVPVNTQILDVTYTARNPDKALEYSQAFADSFLVYRSQKAQKLIDSQISQLDTQIKSNSAALEALAAELSDVSSLSAQGAIIRQQMDALTGQNAALSAKKAEFSTTPLDPGQVVTPAQIQKGGFISLRLLLSFAGLLGGLALGLGFALVRSRFDTRIHLATDVRDAGLSVLGSIGDLPPSTPAAGPLFEEQAADEYRRLRVALFARSVERPTSLLIASASSASRSPVSVSDLGVSLARSGLDTVIIDATSAGIGPSFILGNPNEFGLTDLIARASNFDEAIYSVGPMLWVLGPGTERTETADLLAGGEMSRIMSVAYDRADVVLIATDSLQFGNAQSLATAVSNVVVEVDQGITTSVELERTMRVLEFLPCKTLGAIFITTDARVRTSPFSPEITPNRGQLPRARPEALPPVQSSQPNSPSTPGQAFVPIPSRPPPSPSPSVETDEQKPAPTGTKRPKGPKAPSGADPSQQRTRSDRSSKTPPSRRPSSEGSVGHPQ